MAGGKMMLSYKGDQWDAEPIVNNDSLTNGDGFGG
jgi:hypothetical protein